MDLSSLANSIVGTIKGQFASFMTKFAKIQAIGMQFTQFIRQKIQTIFSLLTQNPRSKKDYFKIMGTYFSKKFIFMTVFIVGILGYVVVVYAYPWADGKIWTSKINLTSEKYTTFSGKARVIDNMGVTVYNGKMENGTPNGYGKQYDSDGNLIYEGDFSKGKYEGPGKLYNTDGVMIYSGAFANNKYEGEGQQYNDNGKIVYVGNFSVGQRSGKGIEYDPKTGLRKYYGEFLNDVREGTGVEYDLDGTSILYEGKFAGGLYSGEGRLYKNGNVIYSGKFAEGLYSGAGSLYDENTGALMYAGEFKSGLYDGEGKLYDTLTSEVVYSGNFTSGKRQGEGTAYDKLGSEYFTGKFRSDSIDYIMYLGKKVEDVTEGFGEESYRTEIDNKLILTYLTLDASVVFKIDEAEGEYVCEKFILGTREDFMGLGANSTSVERRSVMGDPFSSINYNCPNYYNTVFENLAININDITKVPSDKYILDGYFIRFYFNEGRTELKCIEICSM